MAYEFPGQISFKNVLGGGVQAFGFLQANQLILMHSEVLETQDQIIPTDLFSFNVLYFHSRTGYKTFSFFFLSDERYQNVNGVKLKTRGMLLWDRFATEQIFASLCLVTGS